MARRPRKNARRVKAAEAALSKIVPIPKKKTRSRPPASRADSAVHPFVRTLLTQEVVPYPLPAFGKPLSYNTRTFRTRTTLVAGAAVEAAFLCNPWLLYAPYLVWERITNNATVKQFAPTAMINGATTPGGYLVGAAGTEYTAVPFAQQLSQTFTGSDGGYTGHTRPHYVKMNLKYVGTFNNEGGEVAFIHNGENLSYLNTDDAVTAAGANFYSSVTTTPNLLNNTQGVSVHHMGDELEMMWYPNDFTFRRADSYLPITEASVAALYLQNPRLANYIPDEPATGVATQVMPETAWSCGFKLLPAAGTAGATIQYVLEIECKMDLVVNDLTALTATGSTVSRMGGENQAYCHPQHEAQINNALAHVMHQRANSVLPYRSNSTALAPSSLKSRASAANKASIARSVGNAVVDYGVSKILSSFA